MKKEMTREEYLKKQAKTTGKTMEELETLWEAAKERMERNGITDELIIRKAFRRKLRGLMFGKKRRRTPKEFFGFVFGASRLIDWFEIRRIGALKKYSLNPTDAILNGIVDEAGNPLDNREEIWVFGQKKANPNFRKPLVGHSYDRKIFGIAKQEGDDEPKVFKLSLRGRTAKEFILQKPFVAMRFLAQVYSEPTTPWYTLYPTKLTKFTTEKKEKIDYEKWIRTAAHVYKLDKLDQAFDSAKDAKDNWSFLEADLDYINPNIDEDRKQRTINIADDSVGLKTFQVRLPEDFPINFSEFSRVIVMGRIQKFTRRDQSEGVAIEGYGIFPLPGQSVQMPEKESFPAEQREEPIILWE